MYFAALVVVVTGFLLLNSALAEAQTTQTFGPDGKLFHAVGDENQFEKAYILYEKKIQGEDGIYYQGRVRVDFYNETAKRPSNTKTLDFNLECIHIDASGLGIIFKNLDGSTYKETDDKFEFTYSTPQLNKQNKLLYRQTGFTPPRSDWLSYNLWWAVCGYFIDLEDASGRSVKSKNIFQKYLWEPPALTTAEERTRREDQAKIEPDRNRPLAAPNAVMMSDETRIALVIGNSRYDAAPVLPNPVHDAAAIAAALRTSGFKKVRLVTDLNREKLIDALRNFAAEAAAADWAVVYYAGHGIEMSGTNYLIPVDAKLVADRDVQFEAVPLDQVLGAVEGATKLRLIILDACRDNPFTRSMTRTLASRSFGRGLARIEPETGTLVVFAAKDGQQSLDGAGANSPFASAFLKEVARSRVEVRKLFDLVRDDVMEATGRKQQPYTYGSLSGRQEFYFLPN